MPVAPTILFTANDKLLDRAIRHAIFLERYKAGLFRRLLDPFQDDMDELLAETEKEVRRIRRVSENLRFRGQRGSVIIDRLLKQQKRILRNAYRRTQRKATAEWLKLSATEAEFARASIKAAMPVTVDFARPTEGLLKAILHEEPKFGKQIAQHFDDLNRSAQATIRQTTQLGIARGQSIDAIVDAIEGSKRRGFKDGALQGMRNKLNTTVRTVTNSVSSQAREATYKKSNVVKAVRWVSTLDGSTTMICAGLDGKTDPGELGAERPPAHFNCRSTTTPVLKSWKELGINLKESAPGTRAQMPGSKGVATADTTYGQWLKRQPKGFQDDVLGKERAKLFRSGKVRIDRFVDYSRNPPRRFTIEELRRREGL